jgi:NAD(P)-dependent dehydrogenase (short-subunit alcohol dehydrogenase family)
VQFVHINVDAWETATNAAENIRKQFGKLDFLINNAGVTNARGGPPSKVNIEALKAVMNTNYVGAVAVTQAMLPLLQDAGKARIINVSSDLGSISKQTDPNWKYASVKLLAYSASKAVLNMLTVQLVPLR